MKQLLTVVMSLFAVAAFGANMWTLEDQTSPWILPDDALTGGPSGNNMSNLKIGDNQAFNQNYSYEWSFADPKDITSVQLFFAGPSVAVNSISVLCEGAEEYVEVEGSARAQADIGASKYALFAADNGPFATRVIGLKVNIGSANYSHNNGQEILVCGHNSDGVFNWQAGFFDPEGYSRAADDLKAGFAMTGSDSWSNPRANFIDGNPSTVSYLSGGSTIPFAFETPKRIRRVCLHNASYDGGFDIEGIYVKYNGSDEFVRLPNTGLGYFNASANWCVEFNGEGFFARDVIGLQIKFGSCNNLWRFSVGEVEVDGADSFVSTLDADYLIADGKLNTTLTGVASGYPKSVYICTGEADGGKDVSRWDNVVKIGELADAETPVVDSRLVDFKFCRFYFQDADNDAWSEPFELVPEPTAELELAMHGSTALGYQVTLMFCGGTNETVKISAAIAPHGQTMPALTEIKSGVVVGESVSVSFDGLAPLTEYDYQVRIENGDGDFTDLTGSATTRNTTEWVKGTYSTSDWTLPANWISPCGGDFDVAKGPKALYNAKVTSGDDERVGVKDGTYSACFTDAKDIEKIVVFMSGDIKIQVVRVEVLYDGDEEFTVLPHSDIDYMEDGVNAARKLEFIKVGGGWVAENVKEIKITFGDCNPAHVGCSEICFIGQPHAGKIKWGIGMETDSTYAPSLDELSGLTISDSYKAVLTDHDLTTSAFNVNNTWGGATLIWEFEKAMDIRSVRLISATVDVYQGFKAEGVYVKYKGDDDYTYLEGSYLDKFNFGFGQFATFGASSGTGYFARNVVALQVKVSVWDWRVNLAEVECCGRESRGITIIFR